MPYEFDSKSLRSWFLSEARDLPWRNSPTPYHVWVSEVMLQQTRVAVVIPYFERWMRQFPTVEALAKSPIEAVIKAWEGLGYYSRARNLHKGAQVIVQEFGGELPQTAEQLAKIPGLGPYTIGAIRSFAFHQKAAAVDGNVIRVLCRYFGISDDIAKGPTVKRIRELAEQVLPDERPWEIAEALIELGATACAKSANCSRCPIRRSCTALQTGTVQELPVKTKKAKTIDLLRNVVVISHQGYVLVRQVPEGQVMAGLHEFPYLETDHELELPKLLHWVGEELGLEVSHLHNLEPVKHGFTRYRARLLPTCLQAVQRVPVHGHQWASPVEIKKLAFSSGHRRILTAWTRSLPLPA